MYVNHIPFFVTISWHIKFVTIKPLSDRKQMSLVRAFKSVAQIYGFKIIQALVDGEFEPLWGKLSESGVSLNTTARDEHVGNIKKYIHTIKERMCAIYNSHLPFQTMPPWLVIEMAKHAVFYPRAIITGVMVDFTRHSANQFGEYVKTHEEHGVVSDA